MNNERNRKSIFYFKRILPIIFTCILFILCLSNIGCETFAEEGDTPVGVDNAEETEGNVTESEDSDLEEQSQEEALAEEDVSGENGEESLSDTEQENQDELDNNEPITTKIYYADEMGEYLVGESRVVSYKYRYIESLVELLKVPIDNKLVALVPETTEVHSIEIDNGNALVDLSRDFIDDRFISDTVDILLVYSIVNTLTEFSEIDNVLFKIDGEDLKTIGILDISDPLFRRNDLIIKNNN